MVGNSREGFEAYEQLAIFHERAGRNPAEAAALVRQALADLRRTNRVGLMSAALHRQYRERFERRLARLEKKSARLSADQIELRA